MECYTGRKLLPTAGCDDGDHLTMMEQILGPIPPYLLAMCPERDIDSGSEPEVAKHELMGSPSKVSHLAQRIKKLAPLESMVMAEADPLFLDFIRKLLEYDPSLRVSAEEALRLPFLRGDSAGNELQ
mmetsp:Transcript_28795/g.40464  ORF Transcript_28795/g.40464 Transcript_28795/m.40464 type:complete len:127 (-) Transcript_28795:6-386(-)